MPYKDSERKREWEQRHRQERSQRRRVQRAQLSPTIGPKGRLPGEPTPKERSGWGVFLLFAGIALSLPIVSFGFGSGQTDA